MKTSIFILGITILGCTLITNAASHTFVANDSSRETKICIAAAENNKPALKRWLQTNGTALSIHVQSRIMANSLKCNDLFAAAFAKKYNALNTYRYLNRFTFKANRALPTKGTIRDLSAQHNEQANEQDSGKVTLVLVSGR